MLSPPKSICVELAGGVEEEVEHNDKVFFGLGLIKNLRVIWTSLRDLHKYIFENWELIVDGCVQIYPCARGFFVVVSRNVKDINKVL